jgi:hypothetical protein
MADKPDGKRWGWLTTFWVGIVLFAAYMGAYYFTVNQCFIHVLSPEGATMLRTSDCTYAVARQRLPDAVGTFLGPAHRIDRILRPEIWVEDWPDRPK